MLNQDRRTSQTEDRVSKAGTQYQPKRVQDFAAHRLERAHLKDRLVWQQIEGMLVPDGKEG